MANSRSAEKRIRINERRRVYNLTLKSRAKTLIRRFSEAAESADQAQAQAAYSEAASALDRAVRGGAIHSNEAARKKSRMARRLAKIS